MTFVREHLLAFDTQPPRPALTLTQLDSSAVVRDLIIKFKGIFSRRGVNTISLRIRCYVSTALAFRKLVKNKSKNTK